MYEFMFCLPDIEGAEKDTTLGFRYTVLDGVSET